MKKPFRSFLAALAVIASVVCAWGERSPVVLTHTLTGYTKSGRTVTLEYAVQVENQEKVALGPLTLSLVPHPPLVITKATVKVDRLGPKETATVKVKVESALLLEQKHFSRKHFSFAGKCATADGKVMEFPVRSDPGGAK